MGLNRLRKGHFHTQIILNPFPFSISVPIGPWCKGQVSLPFVWPNQNPHKSLAGQPAFLNFIPCSYLFCTVLVSQNPHCWQTEQFLSGFWKNLGKSWGQLLETLKRWSLTWFHPLFGSQWNHIISSFGLASRVPGIDPFQTGQTRHLCATQHPPSIHRPPQHLEAKSLEKDRTNVASAADSSISSPPFGVEPSGGKFHGGKPWAGWSWWLGAWQGMQHLVREKTLVFGVLTKIQVNHTHSQHSTSTGLKFLWENIGEQWQLFETLKMFVEPFRKVQHTNMSELSIGPSLLPWIATVGLEKTTTRKTQTHTHTKIQVINDITIDLPKYFLHPTPP